MRELTCIVCPVGCSLLAGEEAAGALTITGNLCPRGVTYAQEEIRAPRRVVTATCSIAGGIAGGIAGDRGAGSPGLTAPRRVPVKTSAPCPKEKIDELLADIYRLKIKLPVKAGSRPIENWKGTGIDVIVVRSM